MLLPTFMNVLNFTLLKVEKEMNDTIYKYSQEVTSVKTRNLTGVSRVVIMC